MKRSETPIWKRSCLEKLNLFAITNMLDEIAENGDMYGYEETSVEGYYSEYKDQFDDLAGLAYRLTKMELIRLFSRVLAGIVLFYDIKAAHDCLCSIVEELDDRAVLMQRKDDALNALYQDLTGKNGEAFDELIKNLPDRMWVE